MTTTPVYLKRWLRRRSREGIIGLGLLALCAIFYLSALRPAQARIAQSAADLSRTEQAQTPSHQAPTFQSLASAQLSTFYEYFPPQSSTPDWLDKIYAAAHKENIPLVQGEYREKREKTGKLISYQITLPVKGTYLQLRRFVTAVLTDIPIASLDNISFERATIADTVIDAKISLTLYLDRPA